MKIILIALLLAPFFSYSQKKTPVYFKLSPSLLFQKDNDPVFAGHASIDGKFGNHLIAGISGGYIKLKGWEGPLVPLGIDLNIGNFDKGIISPVGTLGVYYPITQTTMAIPGDSYKIKGKVFYQVGGGISITPTQPKKQKIMLTGSFSQLILSNSGRPVTGIRLDKNESLNFFMLSLSFML